MTSSSSGSVGVAGRDRNAGLAASAVATPPASRRPLPRAGGGSCAGRLLIEHARDALAQLRRRPRVFEFAADAGTQLGELREQRAAIGAMLGVSLDVGRRHRIDPAVEI